MASGRTGILAFVKPREGDEITADETIVRLDDDVAQAILTKAEKETENDIEIRYAKKAAAVAKAEYEKSMEANRYARGAVPAVELQRLLLTHERSVLQIEQAEFQFKINELTRDQAQAELETYHVKSPFGGIVTQVYKSVGEAVQQGEPILDLVNTDLVRVEGNVHINDVWKIKRGDRVEVKLDLPGGLSSGSNQRFEGRIVFVGVTAQPVTLRTRVWAEVANRGNILRAGLPAIMTVFPSDRSSADPTKLAKPE